MSTKTTNPNAADAKQSATTWTRHNPLTAREVDAIAQHVRAVHGEAAALDFIRLAAADGWDVTTAARTQPPTPTTPAPTQADLDAIGEKVFAQAQAAGFSDDEAAAQAERAMDDAETDAQFAFERENALGSTAPITKPPTPAECELATADRCFAAAPTQANRDRRNAAAQAVRTEQDGPRWVPDDTDHFAAALTTLTPDELALLHHLLSDGSREVSRDAVIALHAKLGMTSDDLTPTPPPSPAEVVSDEATDDEHSAVITIDATLSRVVSLRVPFSTLDDHEALAALADHFVPCDSDEWCSTLITHGEDEVLDLD